MALDFASGPAGGNSPPIDLVQPFHIEGQPVMGRFVRLGPLVDEVLQRHDYPMEVARLLAEMLALAAGLSSLLKYDGIFTLQVKGDGPISLMVVDATSGGDLRGYAAFDSDRLARRAEESGGPHAPVPRLLGRGYLAFTVDQGQDTDRYQGIVELTGATMADCVAHYFRQSEQIETGIKLAVDRRDDRWRAGGLMVQRLPDQDRILPAADREDDWRRAVVLMGSATDAELMDPALPPNTLLFRLFHEDGVRVYAPSELRAGCRCSRERVTNALASIPREQIDDMKVDGRVEVTCEFCNTTYRFDDDDLDQVYGARH